MNWNEFDLIIITSESYYSIFRHAFSIPIMSPVGYKPS